MKTASESTTFQNHIKGSTRRIRELLKPPSNPIRNKSLKKKADFKFSKRKHNNAKPSRKDPFRASLDVKDKKLKKEFFRTNDFSTKPIEGYSLLVQREVSIFSDIFYIMKL